MHLLTWMGTSFAIKLQPYHETCHTTYHIQWMVCLLTIIAWDEASSSPAGSLPPIAVTLRMTDRQWEPITIQNACIQYLRGERKDRQKERKRKRVWDTGKTRDVGKKEWKIEDILFFKWHTERINEWKGEKWTVWDGNLLYQRYTRCLPLQSRAHLAEKQKINNTIFNLDWCEAE